jgi:hypothetical protein
MRVITRESKKKMESALASFPHKSFTGTAETIADVSNMNLFSLASIWFPLSSGYTVTRLPFQSPVVTICT